MGKIHGSKLEGAGRGYAWIYALLHRLDKTPAARQHAKWRRQYYGRIQRERNAKILARKGRGRIVA